MGKVLNFGVNLDHSSKGDVCQKISLFGSSAFGRIRLCKCKKCQSPKSQRKREEVAWNDDITYGDVDIPRHATCHHRK
jgi:hypothetical protein